MLSPSAAPPGGAEEAVMTWKKLTGGAAALVAAVAAVALLTAFHGGWHGHHRDPAEVAAFVNARVDDALDDLDATPAQRDRIHALASGLLADAMKLRDASAGTHRELVAQWDAEQPDAARLHALVDARIDALRAVAHEAVDDAVQAHAVLTPEQRAKVSRKLHRHADR
jgi:Spy/CpxP family protein refolding chaperone